ncbi:MAG TPA: lipocalin-like domain-containing protein [Candidatus Polarisedimenticolia bacterium]|nr:lipocalin-like domain-containing protein [Candidatus Polarisedimenticolia bacterium]
MRTSRADLALAGTWELVSLESRHPDGSVGYPMGREVTGMLIYEATGHMSVQLMRRGCPSFRSGDHLMGDPAEVKSAYEGYFAYYGTYTLDADNESIAHHVQGASFPNWVGTTVTRRFRLEEDRLTLTSPPMPSGGETILPVSVWRRIG